LKLLTGISLIGDQNEALIFVFAPGLKRISCLLANPLERTKFEVSAGFSHQRLDGSGDLDDTSGYNGFDVSGTKTVTLYLGIKGAFSDAYRKDNFTLPGFGLNTVIRFTIKDSLYTYMGGVQIKDSEGKAKLKSFFHVLAGGATLTQKLRGDCPSDVLSFCDSFNFSQTGFALAAGGGLDVKASKRISIRIIQADYNLLFLGGDTVKNFRVGAGIVFH
jgi:hypothetical protein